MDLEFVEYLKQVLQINFFLDPLQLFSRCLCILFFEVDL